MQTNEQHPHAFGPQSRGYSLSLGSPHPRGQKSGPQWLSHLPFSFPALSPTQLPAPPSCLARPLRLAFSLLPLGGRSSVPSSATSSPTPHQVFWVALKVPHSQPLCPALITGSETSVGTRCWLGQDQYQPLLISPAAYQPTICWGGSPLQLSKSAYFF